MKRYACIFGLMMLIIPGVLTARDVKLGDVTITFSIDDTWDVKEKPTKIKLSLMVNKEAALSVDITAEDLSGDQTPLQILADMTSSMKEIVKKELSESKIKGIGADKGASGLFTGRTGEFGTMQHGFLVFFRGNKVIKISAYGYKEKFEANMKHFNALMDSMKFSSESKTESPQ